MTTTMTTAVHNNLHFIISDYSATGEGSTVSIMVLNPRMHITDNDWEISPHFDENMKFVEGTLKDSVTNEDIALRIFTDIFGGWFAHGATLLSKEEFLQKTKNRIPVMLENIIKENIATTFWYSQLHINLS